METLEDLIRHAIKRLLDDLLQEDPKVLRLLGVYKQRRQYLSKNMDKPKSLPRAELIFAALIRLNRELVITNPDARLFGDQDLKPDRIVIKVAREYGESQAGPAPVDLGIGVPPSMSRPSEQMSLLTALEFPENAHPEILHQSVTRKGPHRVECSLKFQIHRDVSR